MNPKAEYMMIWINGDGMQSPEFFENVESMAYALLKRGFRETAAKLAALEMTAGDIHHLWGGKREGLPCKCKDRTGHYVCWLPAEPVGL